MAKNALKAAALASTILLPGCSQWLADYQTWCQTKLDISWHFLCSVEYARDEPGEFLWENPTRKHTSDDDR